MSRSLALLDIITLTIYTVHTGILVDNVCYSVLVHYAFRAWQRGTRGWCSPSPSLLPSLGAEESVSVSLPWVRNVCLDG